MPTAADNTLIRTEIISTYDKDPQQKFQAFGRKSERFGGLLPQNGIPRVQQYGFTGVPPKKSHAITLIPNGNPDMAMMIGAEHPEHRPKDLAEGEWKLYDMFSTDNFLFAQDDRWTLSHSKELLLKVGDAKITIKNSGDVRILLQINDAKIEMFADGKVHING